MSKRKSLSAKELREVRDLCRKLGKTRGRVSRKYSWEFFYEIKNDRIPTFEIEKDPDDIDETSQKLLQKVGIV